MFSIIKKAIRDLVGFDEFIYKRGRVQTESTIMQYKTLFVPPGHFYSPIPSLEEIRKDEERIFGPSQPTLLGIELHESEQLKLLNEFIQFYKEMPFGPQKKAGVRYFFENEAYSYSDAIMLYCMIRYVCPKTIIEVGSGYSSCVILDTDELFFDNAIETVFIDPYPEVLMSLVDDNDRKKIKIRAYRLQDIDLSEFDVLTSNDILFVDSTHVSKINSDVNYLFFEILPRLSSGVYIHFHDIFFPFEYPREWIYEGRSWNEAYLLRAFLQYNNAFRIVLMNTFMENFHEDFFQNHMPLCLKNRGGSIWIRKE